MECNHYDFEGGNGGDVPEVVQRFERRRSAASAFFALLQDYWGGPSQFSFCADVCSSKEQMIKKKTLKLLQKHKVDPLRLFAAESRALITAVAGSSLQDLQEENQPSDHSWQLPMISAKSPVALVQLAHQTLVPQVETLKSAKNCQISSLMWNFHELWRI